MLVALVAIVGRTNAGKSTLANRLVGEKVSIVSGVEQTTRNTIRSIVSDERGQIVLLDTPGLHKAVGNFGRILNRMARRSAAGADILAVVFDSSVPPQMEDTGWMARVAKEKPSKVVFILNKCDKKPSCAEDFKREWAETEGSGDVNCVWVECAATQDGGADKVLDALFAFAEEGEALFPEDILTDYPRKLAIADVIREKFLGVLHQELPHELAVAVKKIEEVREKGEETWLVDAEVLVNRPSQKPIVIGKGASTIKNVRQRAQRELRDMFGVKVHLELWVRVERNWMENKRILEEMGYSGGEI